MDRGVRKVRESIKQRRKKKDRLQFRNDKHHLPVNVTEEEKHGFYEMPVYDISEQLQEEKPRHSSGSIVMKAFLSVGLFAVISFLMQTTIPVLQQSKEWTYEALSEDFPFAKVNEWYISQFGSPLSFTPQGKVSFGEEETSVLPVLGAVTETFATNGTGILISPLETSVVSAVNRGVVIFAGNDKRTNKTVIIQHADGSKTTYGLLGSIDVHIYETVNANETIGTFAPTEENEMVYFSIEKDREFIDPSQVIPVDDMP